MYWHVGERINRDILKYHRAGKKLSWTHFLLVLPLKDELQREFYLTMAAAENWSKRALQKQLKKSLELARLKTGN